MLAALSHPNIAAIYGVEVVDGRPFLVLELVEGETLQERLKRGPLEPRSACEVSLQIAQALEEAHSKGIVHRDLKPANIELTPNGRVKVIDFGLGKIEDSASPQAAGDVGLADATRTPQLGATTQEGAIMGTASYMSPEQARGQPVDKRSDIWAFGCLLYEMLTGRRAFSGQSTSDILAAVLREPVDLGLLPERTPAPIKRLLKRCLQRDLHLRQQDIGDARLEIEERLQGDGDSGFLTGALPFIAGWLPWGVAVFLFGILLMDLAAPRQSGSPIGHFSIPLAGRLSATFRPAAAISPDGRQLVYVGESSGEFQLFLRPLDGFDATPLDGTMGARNVFWSPDSQWIGFWAEGRLKKVSVRGLPPVSLCRANDIEGASWGGNGYIVYSDSRQLNRVHEEGGTPEPILSADGEVALGIRPELLPGDLAMLFVRGSEQGSVIATHTFATGEERVLMPRSSFVRYVPDGHVLFSRAGAMYASRFDPVRLELEGSPVPLDIDVAVKSSGLAHISVSQNGTLAHTAGSASGPRSLMWIDRDGATGSVIEEPGLYFMPRISPDGRRLAITLQEGGERDVWVIDMETGKRTRLTFDGRSAAPVWSPDGRQLAITSEVEAGREIRLLSADGGSAKRVAYSEGSLYPISWARQSGTLFLSRTVPGSSEDIYILDPEHEENLRPLFQAPVHEQAAVLAPDGRTLALSAWDEGRSRVYLQAFPGPGPRVQVSDERSGMPQWSPDGSELFFLSGGRFDRMMVVSVSTEPELRASTPRLVFQREFGGSLGLGLQRYDISPDGRRFVFATPGTEVAADEICITLDWVPDLERLLTTRD